MDVPLPQGVDLQCMEMVAVMGAGGWDHRLGSCLVFCQYQKGRESKAMAWC